MHTLQRTGKEITAIYDRHVDTVYRICFSFMKNTADTEDMVQETFLRLISNGKKFKSMEHEKSLADRHSFEPVQGRSEKMVAHEREYR